MSTSALEIKQLTKTYPGGLAALKGIDLHVRKGAFFGLLGPNGAGKSTTIGIISALINKSSGQLVIMGEDIDVNFPCAKQQVGVVPQEFNFNLFEKVETILVQQAGFYGLPHDLAKKRAQHYLKALGLIDKRSVKARALSGGMKRRLMIARALVHEPALLILDEPTAGVDLEVRQSMWQFLKELNRQGTTIILTTHYLEEAEMLCDDIAIIDHGKIIAHADKQELLNTLATQFFIFQTKEIIRNLPKAEAFACERCGDHTLQAALPKGQTVNALLDALSQQGLSVISIKNKHNRLEEVFFSLTQKKLES